MFFIARKVVIVELTRNYTKIIHSLTWMSIIAVIFHVPKSYFISEAKNSEFDKFLEELPRSFSQYNTHPQ